MSKRAPPPPPYATKEKRVWVNPDEPPLSDDEVTKLKTGDGKTVPACVYCPNPGFSDDAVRAKAQGHVVVGVQVSANGYPSKISLVRGLPCGLTDKAFEAVERWRFKPATDANGAPLAVIVPVEVTFRLY